jgi:hypothetical protein
MKFKEPPKISDLLFDVALIFLAMYGIVSLVSDLLSAISNVMS